MLARQGGRRTLAMTGMSIAIVWELPTRSELTGAIANRTAGHLVRRGA